MGLGIVRNLVTHTRLENKLPAVPELSMQLTLKAKQNVPFRAPVISKISGCVFDKANPDVAEVPGTPISRPGFALMHCPLNPRPISGFECKLIHLHA